MKKKGEFSSIIVVLALSITALAVVGFLAYLQFNGKIGYFNFLPNFFSANETRNYVEIFRYDLTDGSVKYYDGTSWLDFVDSKGEKSVKINGNVFDESVLKREFEDLFYGESSRQGVNNRIVFSVPGNPSVVFYTNRKYSSQIPLLDGIIRSAYSSKSSTGYVYGITVDFVSKLGYGKGDDKIYGVLSVPVSGKTVFTSINPADGKMESPVVFSSAWNDREEFLREARAWRDSILQGHTNAKALSVNYADEKGKSRQIKTCVWITDEKYLVIDLSKEVTSDDECRAS